MTAQADIRLVNLLSRGVPMAEARKRLGLTAPAPITTPSTKSEKPKPSVPAPAGDDLL